MSVYECKRVCQPDRNHRQRPEEEPSVEKMTVLCEPVDPSPRHRLVALPQVRVRRISITENVFLVEVDLHLSVWRRWTHTRVVHSTFYQSRKRIEPFDTSVLRGGERVLQHVKENSQREERVYHVADED